MLIKNKIALSFFSILIPLVNISCKRNPSLKKNLSSSLVSIEKKYFGTTADGNIVDEFVIKNKNGMEINIITYGAIIRSWTAKDMNNNYQDVVLGFNNLKDYETSNPYFGAVVGRYANRIANGKFLLNGKYYDLITNNGKNHLHGGLRGFDKVIWDAKEIKNDSSSSLELSYLSEDLEEGYPGNLKVKVTYTLNNKDELNINYKAETDKSTIVNLTQHSYFNLTGDFEKDILDHELLINSDTFLPVDSTLIPTGIFKDVTNTIFDFRMSKKIGFDIDTPDEQIKHGLGYDHCWVLNNQNSGTRFAASVYEPYSKRQLDIYTDQPGIQFYSGNFLNGTLNTKTTGKYNFRSGLCLETQHFPDSPNQEEFPNVVLEPGEIYLSNTMYKFTIR